MTGGGSSVAPVEGESHAARIEYTLGVFVLYLSRTSVNRIRLEVYLVFTHRMEARRQPAEHLSHLEPDIYEVML